MNLLYDKFLDYKQIANYRVEYELDNGISLSVKLELSAFPHLIGLHKLTDMPIIRRFNDPNDKVVSAKYITQKIKQQKILNYLLKNGMGSRKSAGFGCIRLLAE